MTKIFTLIIFIMGLIILMLPLKALGQDFITDDDFSLKTKKGIARRGSIAARRAENREAARKRAQAAAKLRIKKKKEKKS